MKTDINPGLFYVVAEYDYGDGDWEQLSIGLDTYEEALKFKDTEYIKEKYPNAFIVCSLKNS